VRARKRELAEVKHLSTYSKKRVKTCDRPHGRKKYEELVIRRGWCTEKQNLAFNIIGGE